MAREGIYAKGNYKTINKVKRLYKEAIKENKARISSRLQGILFSLRGKSTLEIASLLTVNRVTAYSWIINWNELKEKGLYEGYRDGRPNKLNEKNLEELGDIIESGPSAYGLDIGIWTSVIIADIIKQEFNIDYHPGHVRKLLKLQGFSQQKPAIKLYQADKKRKMRWVRYEYPNLKKKRMKKKG